MSDIKDNFEKNAKQSLDRINKKLKAKAVSLESDIKKFMLRKPNENIYLWNGIENPILKSIRSTLSFKCSTELPELGKLKELEGYNMIHNACKKLDIKIAVHGYLEENYTQPNDSISENIAFILDEPYSTSPQLHMPEWKDASSIITKNVKQNCLKSN